MSRSSLLIAVGTVAALTLLGCQKQTTSPTAETPAPTAQPEKSKNPTEAKAIKTYDGPFGLTARMTGEELKTLGFVEVEGSPGLFKGTPPRPLGEPGDYYVVATPKAGLCRIRASYDVNTVNGEGDQIKEKVDQLAEAMSVKYGRHSTKINHISQDVYRRNPEFWMMALREDSVVYAYDWTAGKTEQPMPDGLENVEIVANALTLSSGYAAISYSFDNRKQCMDELKKLKSSNL